MIPPPPLRLVRASVFAAVCVALTCLGHWTAAGRPMAPWTVAVGFAGVLIVAVVLAGHERSLATILGGLLFGQFSLHALFVTGHAHHPDQEILGDGGGGGAGMTAAHVLVAVASALWLRRGERRAWQLARQAARALIRPILLIVSFLAVPVRPAVVPETVPVIRPTAALLRHVVILRGPPARFLPLAIG